MDLLFEGLYIRDFDSCPFFVLEAMCLCGWKELSFTKWLMYLFLLQLKQWYVVNKLKKLAFGALESVSPLLTAVSEDEENTLQLLYMWRNFRGWILTILIFTILPIFYTNKTKISGHEITRMPEARRNGYIKVSKACEPNQLCFTPVFFFSFWLYSRLEV